MNIALCSTPHLHKFDLICTYYTLYWVCVIIDNRAEPGLETSHVMRIVPYVIARAVRVAIGDTFSVLIDLIYAALSKKKEDITDCKKAGKECIYSD